MSFQKISSSLFLGLSIAAVPFCRADDSFSAGPIYDRFPTIQTPGFRTEAFGPFFYSETTGDQKTWAIPPLMAHTRDRGTDSEEFDFLYPLFTVDRFGEDYRWQFLQVFSIAGGEHEPGAEAKRITIFPLYFQQRSAISNENYTAVFPFYGHLQKRLFRDQIFFVMFPLYGRTWKRDLVTDNYLYPFFSVRHGDHLFGWQFWPFYGNEHKDVSTRTNGFGEVSIIGGYDDRFLFWPFFLRRDEGIGTDNQKTTRASLPFFSYERSPGRDSTTLLWPLFSRIDDRENEYKEWQVPWPVLEFARGKGKYANRIWPFYGYGINTNLEGRFICWPLYTFRRIHSEPYFRDRTRILFFLYSDTIERNTDTGKFRRRVDFVPFCSDRQEMDGSSRLQILSLIEPFTPYSKSVQRDYSPLWTVWTSERNPNTGASRQSFLWNLYRHDSAPGSTRFSFLLGLVQYQSGPEGKRLRLFYLPVAKTRPPSGTPRAQDTKGSTTGLCFARAKLK